MTHDTTARRAARTSRLVSLATLVLPLWALGQALDRAALVELDDDGNASYQGVSVDQLEDMDVVRDGQVIGEVEEVLGDSTGQVVALAIEYGGNVLGIGDKEVIVPIAQFRILQDRNQVEISLSDAELDGMTPWRD